MGLGEVSEVADEKRGVFNIVDGKKVFIGGG